MKLKNKYNLVILAVFLGIVFWFGESLLDYYVFGLNQSDFSIAPANSNELWMRIIVFSLLIALGIMADIAIRRSKNHLQRAQLSEQAIEASIDGIAITDIRGNIIKINDAFVDIWKFPREKILTMNICDLFDSREIGERLLANLRSRIINRGEFVSHTEEDKEIYVIYSAGLIVDDKGLPFRVICSFKDITDRRIAEKEIENNNLFLNTTLESLPHPFYVIDVNDYSILLANTAAQSSTLISNPTCYRLIYDQSKPCTGERHVCPLLEVKRTKKPIVVEHLHFDKNGNPINREVHCFPIFDQNGNVSKVIEYILDVTDEKQYQKALAESEERYRILTEESLVGVYIYRAGKFHYVNRQMEKITGYSSKELLNIDPRKVFISKSNSLLNGNNGDIDRTTPEYSIRLRRKDGTNAIIYTRINKIDYSGKEAFLGICMDITQREKAVFDLRNSEKKFRTLTENLNVGVYRNTAVDGELIEANPALVKIFGYDNKEEFLKINVPDTYVDIQERRIFNDKMGKDGYVLNEEVTLKRKDGSHFIASISTSAVRDNEGKIIYYDGIIEDVTERKRNEMVQNTLHKISTAATNTHDLDQLYESIHKHLGQVIDTENFFIALRTDNGSFEFPYCVDRFMKVDFTEGELNRSLTSYVYRSGKPMLIDEDERSKLIEKGEIGLIGEPSKVWMGVPLKTERGIIGVMAFQSYEDKKTYSEADLNIANLISGLIASAIERKRDENSLNRLSHELRIIIDSVPATIWFKDLDNKILRVNKPAADMIHKTPDDIEGRYADDLFPDEADGYYKDDIDVMKTGKPKFGIIEQIPISEDEKRWLRTDKVPFRNEEGEVRGIIVFAVDITETLKQEEELRKLYRAVEQSPNPVVITNTEGIIEYANPKFTKLTGYSHEELIGATPRILKSGRHPKSFYRKLWETVKSGEEWQGEFLNKKKNGDLYWESARISCVKDSDGNTTHYIKLGEDITARKDLELQLLHSSTHDALTDLPNRRLFEDRLIMALAHATRTGEKISVMMLDLDNFKDVNDNLGHSVGDKLLIEVSKILSELLRKSDTVARMGGDEFMIILRDTKGTNCNHIVARKIMQSLSEPIEIDGHSMKVTTSIGIACYPEHGDDVESLTRLSDIAMYEAKRKGKNNYKVFSPEYEKNSGR